MADESLIRCASCRDLLDRVEEQTSPDEALWMEFYRCKGCGRKLMLIWERTPGSFKPEHQTFVEAEAMKRGAFFPTDIHPNRFGR